MTIHQVKTDSLWYEKGLVVRNEILRKPLNLNIYDEDLSDEANQIHFVAEHDSQILGTVSLVSHYGRKYRKASTNGHNT